MSKSSLAYALVALGVLFLLFGGLILAIVFWVLAAVAFMIWRMRR